MAAAVDELRVLGFDEAILWVLDGNTRARRFYELAGWQPDGAEKQMVWRGVEVHEVRYRRALNVRRLMAAVAAFGRGGPIPMRLVRRVVRVRRW